MARDRSLDAYQRKRDFGKTPEPAPLGGEDSAAAQSFVVHRHDATRLHYDLRLQIGGVLKSWAVPRGFSYVPRDKRLAVRTEDHPLEYLQFEGVIPEGEYGAGTMEIWDRGRYEIVNGGDPAAWVDAGKLELRLWGKRLRGEWHLVETRRAAEKAKGEWLLFKAHDTYSRSEDDSPYPFQVDLDRAKLAAGSRPLRAMSVGPSVKPFSDPEWLYEVELDGRRVFAVKKGSDVTVRESRSRTVLRQGVDEVVAALAGVRAETAVFDGVLVCLDDGQRPSATALEARLRDENGGGIRRESRDENGEENDPPVTLCVVDILYYDEWNVRPLPLLDRKRLVAALLPASRVLSGLDHVVGEGEKFCSAVALAGLSGVIAKPSASVYAAGQRSSWRRIRIDKAVASADTVGALDALQSTARNANRASRVRITNRNKVYWPEAGYTKGDLIDFYQSIAETLLPYLYERPLHMHRFPDGINGKSFYHHNAPPSVPDWVTTEEVVGQEGNDATRYILCNDRDTLLYLANLGSIDLHPWLSRRDRLDTPDWLIFDLDPGSAPFAQVVRVARAVGKILHSMSLRCFLKTSGKSGLHVCVPLLPQYTYDQARTFAEGVARYVALKNDKIATVERVVARRGGKVYIDYLQNRRGQTVVPPYVLRPVAAASVSTPLDWDELSSELDPAAFTIETVPSRIARLGDVFEGALTDRQDLLPAIEAFREMIGPSDAP